MAKGPRNYVTFKSSNVMTYLLKSAMMYRAVRSDYNVNFSKSFFELEMTAIHDLGLWAELFKIKSSDGKSPARTLFDRLKQYHEKYILEI